MMTVMSYELRVLGDAKTSELRTKNTELIQEG